MEQTHIIELNSPKDLAMNSNLEMVIILNWIVQNPKSFVNPFKLYSILPSFNLFISFYKLFH